MVTLKPFMVYIILKLARERELDHGVQSRSLVDSFPTFGNWKVNHNVTPHATFQNSNNGYQQSD